MFYEAPHRIHQTLKDIAEKLGNRQIALGRELTKTHEQLAIRPISAWLSDLPPDRGEFVLVVGPPEVPDEGSSPPSDIVIAETFGHLTEFGQAGRREALRETAKRHGVSTKQVFDALERAKKLGK